MDYSPQGSSIHRNLQARIWGWVAMPSFRLMRVSVSAKQLKRSHPVYRLRGNQDPAPRLHSCFSWLFLPCLCIPSLSWLTAVWTYSLELREGPGAWMKTISYNQEMRDSERLLCRGDPQGPVRYQDRLTGGRDWTSLILNLIHLINYKALCECALQ